MMLPALVYTRAKADLPWAMYLIAMLRAKNAEVQFYHLHDEAVPETLRHYTTPFFVDRGLVATGHALEELIHDRYPGPAFLPATPINRAQVRMLVAELQRWYDADSETLMQKLLETSEVYTRSAYFLSATPTAFDWALVPLLARAVDEKLQVFDDPCFKAYAKRVLAHPAVDEAWELLNG